MGIGRYFALRAEGLARKADSYFVPAIKLNENPDYVPDTHNKSRVGTPGFSWIGKKGYLGAAYSYRKDRYGIPGHNHAVDTCSMHFVETGLGTDSQSHHYLDFYPHLYDEKTMIKSVHPHCGVGHGSMPHSREHPYGHEHIHGGGGPYIQMHSRRVDIQGEWRQPFSGLEKIKISLAKARYYHGEWHDGKLFAADKTLNQYEKNQAELATQKAGKAESAFGNKGLNARLELYHQKIGSLSGVRGVQYQTQKTVAERFFEKNKTQDRYALPPNTDKQFSLFAIGQFKWRNFTFEAGARWEKQRISIDYDRQAVNAHLTQKACRMPLFSGKKVTAQMIGRDACENAGGTYSLRRRGKLPDFTPYRETALSYSGSLLWDFHPDYRLSATVSHNERLPSVMELYYHGKHLATNSFEYGNKNLKPEKSDNFELGLSHASEKWRYRISAYHNRFDNYIHSENVFRSCNLYARRYNQSQARFHGVEGEISFLPASDYALTLFGDYVRGRLKKLPAIYDHIPTYADNADGTPCESDCTISGYESVHVPDRNAARVPPARIRLRLTGRFNPHWDGSLEYTRVFTQNKTSVSVFSKRKSQEKNGSRLESVRVYEDKTPGYHLINGSLSYRNKINGINYQLALYANNLPDEKIYVHTSFLPYVPQMGRNFIVQFNAEF